MIKLSKIVSGITALSLILGLVGGGCRVAHAGIGGNDD
jgi:hypothetical protein